MSIKLGRRSFQALVTAAATVALALGISAPSFAVDGNAKTGEWDLFATSQAADRHLSSYQHEDLDGNSFERWEDAKVPAYFAVGSNKHIEGVDGAHTTDTVKGGGFRFENKASTPKFATFTITVPAGVGVTLDSTTGDPIHRVVPAGTSDGKQKITIQSKKIEPNEKFHQHFSWKFDTAKTDATFKVNVSVGDSLKEPFDYVATGDYRFTF